MDKMTECVHDVNRKPLNIKDDPMAGIVDIEGIRYSHELLKSFAGQGSLKLGQPFVITKRGDGIFTIQVTKIEYCPYCGKKLKDK